VREASWLPAFDAAFWAAFWPEAFAGLITGLVVGIVLLMSQYIADRRVEKRKSELDWATIRGSVERAIVASGAFSVVDVYTTGFGRKDIEELLTGRPLEQWIKDLKLKELTALRDFLRASDEVDQAAYAFMLRTTPLIAAESPDEGTREQIRRRIFMKARHAKTDLIEAFLPKQHSQIVAAADKIFLEPDVRAAHKRHRAALKDLSDRRSTLIASLGLEEPEFAPLVLSPTIDVPVVAVEVDPADSGPPVRTRAVGKAKRRSTAETTDAKSE
jgi:hypothetical protein